MLCADAEFYQSLLSKPVTPFLHRTVGYAGPIIRNAVNRRKNGSFGAPKCDQSYRTTSGIFLTAKRAFYGNKHA